MLTMRSSTDDVRMTYVPADNMRMTYMPADNVRMTYLPADNMQTTFRMTYVIRQPKSPTKSRSRVVHASSACRPHIICTSSAVRFQPQNISSQRAENSSAKNEEIYSVMTLHLMFLSPIWHILISSISYFPA